MKEYIEMASSSHHPTSSSSLSESKEMGESVLSPQKREPQFMENANLIPKVVRRDFELRTISRRSISYWWVLFPVCCYSAVLVGGIMTSIGVGNVFTAFEYYCLFNANLTIVVREEGGVRLLEEFNINSWGSKVDCNFSEYGSVALALFSGIWIVMVLQCGRGGISRRGFRLPDAWRIVPPTCIINTGLFILSAIILSKVSNGFVSFCDNSIVTDETGKIIPKEKISCSEILSFSYSITKRSDKRLDHTNLLTQERISQAGATIQFIGCLLSFIGVILRCCIGPDFDLYVKTETKYLPAPTEEQDNQQYDNNDEDVCEFENTKTNPSVPNPNADVILVDVECHDQWRLNEDLQSCGNDDKSSITSRTKLVVN